MRSQEVPVYPKAPYSFSSQALYQQAGHHLPAEVFHYLLSEYPYYYMCFLQVLATQEACVPVVEKYSEQTIRFIPH